MSMGCIRVLLADHKDRIKSVPLYASGDWGVCAELSGIPEESDSNLIEKKIFMGGVCVERAQVVNLFYLFLEAGVCLHKHHDRYSDHLDPALYDEDRDPVQGFVCGVHGVVRGDRDLFPDGISDPQFSVLCQDSSLCTRQSIEV